jgi:iduronate 2-sulfatase
MFATMMCLGSCAILVVPRGDQRCAAAPAILNNTNLGNGGYKSFICAGIEACRSSCCADDGCAACSWAQHAKTNGSTIHGFHNCSVGDPCCYLKDQTYNHKPITPFEGASAIIPHQPSFSKTKQNVLMLVVDDLRNELNAFGAAHMYTPNIDALANRSLVLRRNYVQQSVCGPTRASIMVSRRPDSTRTVTHSVKCATTKNTTSRGSSCYWRDVAGNFSTIPQLFKEAGYYSASFGKTFDPRTSNNCDMPYSWSEPPVMCSTHGTGAGINTHGASHMAVDASMEEKLIDVPIAKAAIAFLQSYNHDSQPFFLAVGFHRPHLPFVVPERVLAHYPSSSIQRAANDFAPMGMPRVAFTHSGELIGQYTFNGTNGIKSMPTSRGSGNSSSSGGGGSGGGSSVGNAKDWGGWSGDINTTMDHAWEVELRRYYYAAVTHTDEMVGEMVGTLDRLGIAGNTIVAFWGDHGWHLSENNLWGKCTNFGIATRAPMMVHVPNVTDLQEGGVHTFMLAEHVDLMPTLLAAAKLAVPPRCDPAAPLTVCTEGMSLLPLVTAPTTPLKDAAFSQFPVPGAGGMRCRPKTHVSLNETGNEGITPPAEQHPSHMGYTMATAEGERFTEWVLMEYDGVTGAFLPQWSSGPFDLTLSTTNSTCSDKSEFEYYAADDAEENCNLAADRAPTPAVLARMEALRDRLHAGWQGALATE